MLSGRIFYHNDNVRHTYNAVAEDSFECFSIYLSSGSYDAMGFLSAYPDDGVDFDERRCDIKLVKVCVETNMHKDERGKNVKDPCNAEFFCRLGALIRYAKNNCNPQNEEGYLGLQLASSEFEAVTNSKYVIKFPDNPEKEFARVTLSYGIITAISLQTEIFTIEFEQSYGEQRVFYALKDAWQSGFKFDADYLGFIPVTALPTKAVSLDGLYHSLEEVQAAHPDKNFGWLRAKNYYIVTDETLEDVCNYIAQFDGLVYYDTETTGLNINFYSRLGQADQCVGIILSVKYGESFFFPVQMKRIKNLCGGDHWYFMEHYMRPILEGKQLVAHNLPFDWKVGYIYDINCNIVEDTQALIKLTLGAEIQDYPTGLKENAKLLLKRDSLELSDLVVDNSWGENDIKFWDLDEELTKLYACADTDNTNGLKQYALQNDLLGKYNARKVYEIEIAFGYAVGYQEFYGHHIDINNVDFVREQVYKNQQELMKKMVDIVGHEFNPNSSPQLLKIMYGELGIPEQISRKTNRPSADKKILERLSKLTDLEDNLKYPFCKLLLEYRREEGVRKIIDTFPECVTPDGYVFSEVYQYGTTTGRVSIHNPNYQSYNDVVKQNIIPRPGFWAFDTDYSSVEYRVLANMVGNKRIMTSFEDPDFDYHTYQAAHLYRIPYAAVTKKMRKGAKSLNFGIPYGMGDESIGESIHGVASEENTREAAALKAAYFKGQEDIRDWFEYHRNRGVTEGFTETYFGRRRYYHKSKFSDKAIRRQAGNQVIQGCESFDTYIQTYEFGIVKIGEIVGYDVTVWDGEDWTKGSIVYSGKKKLCRVHFKGGLVFECSPTHRFKVRSRRGNDRFVEAQYLVGLDATKNAHRVVINPEYAESVYEYDTVYDFSSNALNSNNYSISDLTCGRFEKGVLLGRLASDGNYPYDVNSTSSRVEWIVAEHEESIINELISYMSEWNPSIDTKDVREGRNERMTYISVYSKSLVRELQDLDLRHCIPDEIFMDTEMLRGYLCGFFDGDGGISGKTIAAVQGTQYEFEPMMKDIQKALLFFGIRSRYRRYDDRYVVQIKTTDNERFFDIIGFLNQGKQNKGRELECVEDEHIFGRCLLVDYVEFTDEEVDMYDVCNTERGYYVADGVVTHNSAADIYKMAVGRVFKRICREGWLGKVLFSGFIHDELFGEVSNDINPAIWLKVLREEFEVKIYDDKGNPWCPLYMGFGFGMSWYEAKSVEIPIKLQWELVEKYGETGFPNWDGDGRKFADTVPDMLREFEVRDITTQITSSENQNQEIKPALNTALLECVKTDAKVYEKAIMEATNNIGVSGISGRETEILDYLDRKYHIQGLYRQDGNYALNFEPSTKTQDALDQFCMLHGVDRNRVNLIDIQEATEASVDTSQVKFISGGYDDDEDGEQSEDKKKALMDSRIMNFGLFLDVPEKKVYLLGVQSQYTDYIKQLSNTEGQGYQIYFVDFNGVLNPNKVGQMYSTKCYLTSDRVQLVQQMYFMYFKRALV